MIKVQLDVPALKEVLSRDSDVLIEIKEKTIEQLRHSIQNKLTDGRIDQLVEQHLFGYAGGYYNQSKVHDKIRKAITDKFIADAVQKAVDEAYSQRLVEGVVARVADALTTKIEKSLSKKVDELIKERLKSILNL